MLVVCNKRCALLCAALSIWAIMMLTLMGILLYLHAIAFAEDLGLEELHSEATNLIELLPMAYQRYESAAHNCWIAVCLYIATLVVSLQQYYFNRRQQYMT